MMAQDDKERLLGILQAHGRRFLGSFDLPDASEHEANGLEGSESEEEWTGICLSSNNGVTSETVPEDECNGGFEQGYADSGSGPSRTPDVMIYSESTRKQPEANISASELRKLFMSSKVSNVTSMQLTSKEKMPTAESDDERTNIQNDALLHRLVHTKLLSGSLNPEHDLTHAQKNRALAGRVLELAGEAKLGNGETVFRQEQRNKAAKHVRDGLIRKRRDMDIKTLEEAKNLGNYHPTLKRLYDSNISFTHKKKRARGLGMGVGKFAGGTLKLSREEIVSVTGSGDRLRDNGRRRMRQTERPRNKHHA